MKLVINQYCGLKECPYFRRWVIPLPLGYAIRIHNWLGEDDTRYLHDHPFWMVIICISGGYTDVNDNGLDILRIGSIRFRKATYKHSVTKPLPNTWTLLITGPDKRRWGFWVKNKLIKRDKYFIVNGHHPCDKNSFPIRIKPDGTRL